MPSSSRRAHGVSITHSHHPFSSFPPLCHEWSPTTQLVAANITLFFCSRVHHEKWQLIGFTIIQTALIASMASVGLNDKAQAIVTVIIGAASITPPQLLSFVMLSLGIKDQADM